MRTTMATNNDLRLALLMECFGTCVSVVMWVSVHVLDENPFELWFITFALHLGTIPCIVWMIRNRVTNRPRAISINIAVLAVSCLTMIMWLITFQLEDFEGGLVTIAAVVHAFSILAIGYGIHSLKMET